MHRKFFLIMLLISVSSLCSFQALAEGISAHTLRKLVMKSDVIFAGTCVEEQSRTNDYTTETYLSVTKIDRLLKSNAPFEPGKQKIKGWSEGEDYFALSGTYLGEVCPVWEEVPKLCDLVFLKKDGDNYRLLGRLTDVEWSKAVTHYFSGIVQLEEIEKTTDPALRYTRTIDWFITNDGYPDDSFLTFYKEKGICNDTLSLSKEQLQRALKEFLKGKENLLPFVEKAYRTEVKAYYLKKLKKIRFKSNIGSSDYYEFRKVISYYFKLDYDSMDYLTNNLLTSDFIEKYEKTRIMNHFIKMLEDK